VRIELEKNKAAQHIHSSLMLLSIIEKD